MTAPLTCSELLAIGALVATHPRPRPDLAQRCYALGNEMGAHLNGEEDALVQG